MAKEETRELGSSIDKLALSEKTLTAFRAEDTNVGEVKENYQRLAISALTICCTCD